MYIYINIYIQTYIYIYIHTHTHIYINIHIIDIYLKNVLAYLNARMSIKIQREICDHKNNIQSQKKLSSVMLQ